MEGLHVHGKCFLGRHAFKGEMLSLLGLEIRREVGKMLPQSRGVDFVRKRGVCKQDGGGNRKVRPARGTLR